MAGDDPELDAPEPMPERSPRAPRTRRVMRWLGTGLVALLVVFALVIAWLHTGWGRQWIAERIAANGQALVGAELEVIEESLSASDKRVRSNPDGSFGLTGLRAVAHRAVRELVRAGARRYRAHERDAQQRASECVHAIAPPRCASARTRRSMSSIACSAE